jgi:excisionase family DNA binding protein
MPKLVRDISVQPFSEWPDILLQCEVASLFRVKSKTVARWASEGKIDYFRTVGTHRRYRKADVWDLLQKQEEEL